MEVDVESSDLPPLDTSATADISPESDSPTASDGNQNQASTPPVYIGSKSAPAKVAEADKPMVSLAAGDLIWLKSEGREVGTVLGDISQRTVGVEPDLSGSSQGGAPPSLRFSDAVFRLCPRLNYRSKHEVSQIIKSARQSDTPSATKKELNYDLAVIRNQNEVAQNAELLEKLVHPSPGVAPEPIRYGDLVQLQHLSSGLFVAMHKTPAPLNPNCRRVSLKAGSLAAHFRITPRFKVRSMGSLVYADDQIVLHSVKHEALILGGSSTLPPVGAKSTPKSQMGPAMKRMAAGPCYPSAALNLRLPRALATTASGECNGSVELRSFTIKLFGRLQPTPHDTVGALMTSLHMFRLFHPEANAFLQASANPDKGEILDALGTSSDPLRIKRHGGTPAHVPYLKVLPGGADAGNPLNLSAKACWSFENVDRANCSVVRWKSMPLRIRHVPSGKYLSVNSISPTTKVRRGRNAGRAAAGAGAGLASKLEGANGGGDEDVGGISSSPQDVGGAGEEIFDVALVDDADPNAIPGSFGSEASMVFQIMPTDVAHDGLRRTVATLRLEHRPPATATRHRVLHCVAPRGDLKPPFVRPVGTPSGILNGADSFDGGASVGRQSPHLKKTGGRVCFSSEASGLDVLKLIPVLDNESRQLRQLMAYVPLHRRFAYMYQVAADVTSGTSLPLGLCEAMSASCLDIMDLLRRGLPPPRRHNGSVPECMKEAHATKAVAFSTFFGGEPDMRMQKMACELKLLDAVFGAAVAPYNYAAAALRRGGPFNPEIPGVELLSAVQKFLFVTVQRCIIGNVWTQEYFASHRARTWQRPHDAATDATIVAANSVTAFESNGVAHTTEDNVASFKDSGSLGDDSPVDKWGTSHVMHKEMVRRWEPWRNTIIGQGEESMGATVTLGLLLCSTEQIVNKLVNNELIDRFKNLSHKCGPEVRLVSLFSAVCYIEGQPSRANQEMCVRKLWMNLPDRYAFGVTFHEIETLPKTIKFGEAYVSDGTKASTNRTRAPPNAPKAYLGKSDSNGYKPVCVAWLGTEHWQPECGYLWWSPESMQIPVVETRKMEGLGPGIDLVPLESLMWVLDPARLCKPVTGQFWKPFNVGKKKQQAVGRAGTRRAAYSRISELSEAKEKTRYLRFQKQVQLATFVVAELELLNEMCKGRSYNCIAWIEKSFPYELLMNISTNPLLPYDLTAAAIMLINAVYVDRYPQFPFSGAPCLPERLWIYDQMSNEFGANTRRSSTPVIQPVTLDSDAAFPHFSLPALSSALTSSNPIISHPDHFKFFLYRTLCNETIRRFGSSRRILHNEQELNMLGMAAISGQSSLLEFGFQSTYVKLRDLCHPNGQLLDGRSDLEKPGTHFNPPQARYRNMGSKSAIVTKLKLGAIDTFLGVIDLRTNFRLACLLQNFKKRVQVWENAESRRDGLKPRVGQKPGPLDFSRSYSESSFSLSFSSKEIEARDFILQSNAESAKTLFDEFEAMFPGGKGEAAKLDLAALADKPDFDQALIDTMMYEDDTLMAAALALLESNYAQRRALQNALQNVELLETPNLAVYGDIHVLRSDLSELMYLARTSSVWGVSSRISGSFDNKAFGDIMGILDRLMVFMHTKAETPAKERPDETVEPIRQKRDHENKGSPELWSDDIAARWGPRLVDLSGRNEVEAKHQDVLRACKIQDVLIDAVRLDHQIAWKGSICSDQEKVESERRLTLVKRAILCVCTAFVCNNKINQELLFVGISTLEEMATPSALQITKDEDGNANGLDTRTHEERMAAEASLNPQGTWPHAACDFSQYLIESILRSNTGLCERVRPSLLALFCQVANLSPDVSVSPALDLIFILAKPENTPDREHQILACNLLVSSQTSAHGLERLFQALTSCFVHASSQLLRPVASSSIEIKNPSRIIRLVKVVIEGGNEEAATILQQTAGITIDATCSALVAQCEKAEDTASKAKLYFANSSPRTTSILEEVDATWQNESSLSPEVVLEFVTLAGSTGAELLSLLVEQFFVLPLNTDQIMSPALWAFIERCAVPFFEAIGRLPTMDDRQLEICADLVDFLEKFMTTLVRLGLFDSIKDIPSRERALADMSEDIETLLSKRQKTPEFLKTAFLEEVEKHQRSFLEMEEFVVLIVKLTESPNAARKISEKRRKELEEEFRRADADNSGGIDLYEFEALYEATKASVNARKYAAEHSADVELSKEHKALRKNVTVVRAKDKLKKKLKKKSLREADMEAIAESEDDIQPLSDVKVEKSNILHHQGHRLSLRTVECGERIVHIFKGRGNELGAKRFDRHDKLGARRRDSAHGPSVKLFKRSSIAPETNQTTNPSLNEELMLTGEIVSTSTKLQAFKEGVAKNVFIQDSMQGRRFKMVSVLEKGCPGPPEGVGRSLSMPLPNASKKPRKQPRSNNSGSDEKAKPKFGQIAPETSSSAKKGAFNGKMPGLGMTEARAAALVQGVFRRKQARETMNQIRACARNDGGNRPNPLSGAVELHWVDIVHRFVEYIQEHFWEPRGSSGHKTCTLILNTWMAHLMKARTRPLAADGSRLPQEAFEAATRFEQVATGDLDEQEQQAYEDKQSLLNEAGVTQLLAKLVASLSLDTSEGALPDLALELLCELLNGGHPQVQRTLYSHLVKDDTEGKLLSYVGRRLQKASEGLAKRRRAASAKNDVDTEDDESPDCESAIVSARFLQLLCEGHFKDFQEYIRVQPMNSQSLDLVKAVSDLVVAQCASSYVCTHFTHLELEVVAQLLNTLIDAMLGPCAGNQDLLAKSELVPTLNSLLPAVNARDEACAVSNPRHLTLRALSCVLMAACLEGREDRNTHVQLERRLEIHAIEEYRDWLDTQVRECIVSAKNDKRLPTPDEMLKIKTLQTSLVAVVTVLVEIGGPDRFANGMSRASDDNDSLSSMNGALAAISLDSAMKLGAGGLGALTKLGTGGLGAAFKLGSGGVGSLKGGLKGGLRGGLSGVAGGITGVAGGITGVAGGLTGGLKGGLGAAMKLGGGALNMGFNANQWAAELAHAAALRDIGPLVGQVEIAWRGKIERSCFPLPFEINYLPEKTRAAFLEEVDLQTSEKRMKALLKASSAFIEEMELIYHKAEQSRVYRSLHKHLPRLKSFVYVLVVILNLNVLFSPARIGGTPNDAFLRHFSGERPLDFFELASLCFTTVLMCLVLAGYAVIVQNLWVTEIPLLVASLDDAASEALEDALRQGLARPPKEAWAPEAWAPFFSGIAGSVLFGCIHALNFPAEEGLFPDYDDEVYNASSTDALTRLRRNLLKASSSSTTTSGVVGADARGTRISPGSLYLTLLLGLVVPSGLYSLRQHIGDFPYSSKQRRYAIVYDTLVHRSFLRNHVGLGACCILGFFFNEEFFTLELLDIVVISPVIADIIKSVTSPGIALGLVFYLFCVSVLIYASFGRNHFAASLKVPYYDAELEESVNKECHSLLGCFYMLAYQGLSEAGNIKAALQIAQTGTADYPLRIIFDSVFFIWVGVVLMNIITGLMVDTFSSIREEKATREEILASDCFVCGLQRNAYEDMGLGPNLPTFDKHLSSDHDLWSYVYYVAYLRKKDPTEDSGIESYVRQQVSDLSLEWIPNRSCFVLEAQRKGARKGSEGIKSSSSGSGVSTDQTEVNARVALAGVVRAKKQDAAIQEVNRKLDELTAEIRELAQSRRS